MKRERLTTDKSLMEAAREIFTEKGFAASSIREIVAKSGVTKPTLYYYFGSKENLYRSLIEESFTRFNEQTARIAEADLPPKEKLIRVVNHHLDDCRRFPQSVKLTLMALYRCDTFAPEIDIKIYVRPGLEAIARIIEEGMEIKLFKKDNPLKLCLQLIGMIHIQTLVTLKGAERLPLSRAEELVHTFIHGIRK